MKVFGPASISHIGTDLGKTFKGGSYQFTSIRKRKAGPFPTYESIVVGGNGTIKMFEIDHTLVITNTLEYRTYGQLIFTLKDLVITIHKAKLYLPEKLDFGTNVQTSFDLDFVFAPDEFGQLITLSHP